MPHFQIWFWETGSASENHSHPAPQLDNVYSRVLDVFPIEKDFPVNADSGYQIVHPVKATQKSTFAASGRSDERGSLFFANIDANLVKRFKIAVIKIELFDGEFYCIRHALYPLIA
jgi:hypothetical protein